MTPTEMEKLSRLIRERVEKALAGKPLPPDMGVPYSRYTEEVAGDSPVCDCGAERARTTHADWCSTEKKGRK